MLNAKNWWHWRDYKMCFGKASMNGGFTAMYRKFGKILIKWSMYKQTNIYIYIYVYVYIYIYVDMLGLYEQQNCWVARVNEFWTWKISCVGCHQNHPLKYVSEGKGWNRIQKPWYTIHPLGMETSPLFIVYHPLVHHPSTKYPLFIWNWGCSYWTKSP